MQSARQETEEYILFATDKGIEILDTPLGNSEKTIELNMVCMYSYKIFIFEGVDGSRYLYLPPNYISRNYPETHLIDNNIRDILTTGYRDISLYQSVIQGSLPTYISKGIFTGLLKPNAKIANTYFR